MYTEFDFNVELRGNVPKEVIFALAYMVRNADNKPAILPRHELFEGTTWEHMLLCDSYYFSADTHSTLRYDIIGECYYLCIRCNFKNYGDEIKLFLDWIFPYVREDENFVGFFRYEEDDVPTLIFAKDYKRPCGSIG